MRTGCAPCDEVLALLRKLEDRETAEATAFVPRHWWSVPSLSQYDAVAFTWFCIGGWAFSLWGWWHANRGWKRAMDGWSLALLELRRASRMQEAK